MLRGELGGVTATQTEVIGASPKNTFVRKQRRIDVFVLLVGPVEIEPTTEGI
jgi:tRNA nucleotidyltransferase (CCA-adding enzyme)